MVQLRDAKTRKPCFGSHFRSFLSQRGGTAAPSLDSPRARHFTDLLSVGVGDVPPHFIRPKSCPPWHDLGTPKQGNPVLAHILRSLILRKMGRASVPAWAVFGIYRDFWFFRRFLCEEACYLLIITTIPL